MKNFNEILKVCNNLLNEHSLAVKAKEYLDSRIKDDEIKNQFGYFPSSENLNIITDYIKEDDLIKNNLLYYKYIDDTISYRKNKICILDKHNLIMPYYDVYGNIVSLVGRSLLNDKDRKELGIDKYKNTTFEKRNHLFGLNVAKKEIINKDCVYVVEGQFDQLKCYENGLKNVVAVGSCNLSFQQLSLISRYTRNINIMFDNDDGGRAGNQRIKNKFGNYRQFKFNFIEIPNMYKDIDELINQEGIEYFNNNVI